MVLCNVHFCFHSCKNYKNRPRNARVIVKNKAVPFLLQPLEVQLCYSAETYSDDDVYVSVCVVGRP